MSYLERRIWWKYEKGIKDYGGEEKKEEINIDNIWLPDWKFLNYSLNYFRSLDQEEMGKVYDKKPFKFMCEKGKSYR